MTDNLITIRISQRSLQWMLEKLALFDDKGPPGEGWQSDELIGLIAELERVQPELKQEKP